MNKPQTDAEVAAIRKCIRRGGPYGDDIVDQEQRDAVGAGKDATASRTAKKGKKRVLWPLFSEKNWSFVCNRRPAFFQVDSEEPSGEWTVKAVRSPTYG